jgi:hypothetical protein
VLSWERFLYFYFLLSKKHLRRKNNLSLLLQCEKSKINALDISY